jgi:hypothetical protein
MVRCQTASIRVFRHWQSKLPASIFNPTGRDSLSLAESAWIPPDPRFRANRRGDHSTGIRLEPCLLLLVRTEAE